MTPDVVEAPVARRHRDQDGHRPGATNADLASPALHRPALVKHAGPGFEPECAGDPFAGGIPARQDQGVVGDRQRSGLRRAEADVAVEGAGLARDEPDHDDLANRTGENGPFVANGSSDEARRRDSVSRSRARS